IESKVSQIKQDDDIHHLYKEGFDNLCAAGNFHNYEWFSNVVVSSEENDWYRK
ncbi:10464_t:CDS:2, partial [Funneliformis geosporum]